MKIALAYKTTNWIIGIYVQNKKIKKKIGCVKLKHY